MCRETGARLAGTHSILPYTLLNISRAFGGWYNEKGKHVRTKKEILDENGNLREGCNIIPKGEDYESYLFDVKIEYFKSKAFISEVKEMYTKLMNKYVKEESQRLSVFQLGGSLLLPAKGNNGTTVRRNLHLMCVTSLSSCWKCNI